MKAKSSQIIFTLLGMFSLFAILMATSSPALAQEKAMSKELKSLYDQYDHYRDERRPQSAKEAAQKIMNYGDKHRQLKHLANAAMMIYAVDNEEDFAAHNAFLQRISEMSSKTWLSKNDASLLLFMRASALLSAYNASHDFYRFNPSERITPTLDEVDAYSNDISLWTKGQYQMALAELLPKLFEARQVLAKISALDYEPLFATNVKPSLYHTDQSLYVAMIEHLSDENLAKLYPAFKDEFPLAMPLLQNDFERLLIEKLALSVRLQLKEISSKSHFEHLTALLKKYPNEPSGVELLRALVSELIQKEEYLEAKRLAEEYIQRFPTYYRIGQLQDMLDNQIFNPELRIRADRQFTSQDPIKLRVSSRLINSITVEIYQANDLSPESLHSDSSEKNLRSYTKGKPLLRKELKINARPDLRRQNDTLQLSQALPRGMYIIKLVDLESSYTNKKRTDSDYIAYFSVSDYFAIQGIEPGKGKELQILDAATGAVREGVTISAFKYQKGKKDFLSDAMGRLALPDEYNAYYPHSDEDKHYLVNDFYSNSVTKIDFNKKEERVFLVSDRALYRPGQRLYFFGQKYQVGYHIEAAKVLPGGKLTIKLKDVNREEIAQQECEVDDFGRFEGYFDIPKGGLNGSYELSCLEIDAECEIHVEEYKRPSFEVEIESPKESYTYNSKLLIKGLAKAFSGIPIDAAELSYRLSLSKYSFWRFGESEAEVLETGKLQTADDGSFSIPITLRVDTELDEDSHDPWVFFRFDLQVDVLAKNGETQSNSIYLALGKEPTELSLRVQSKDQTNWLKEELPKLSFNASNAFGKSVSKEIRYRLLDAKGNIIGDTYTIASDSLFEAPKAWASLPSADYKLSYCLSDYAADKNKWEEHQCYLFSLRDKEYKGSRKLWLYVLNDEYEEGKDVEVLLALDASQSAGRYLFYHLSHYAATVDRQMLSIKDNSIIRLKLAAPKHEMPENMRLSLYYVLQNTLYQEQAELRRQQPQRGYSFAWSSFRNKLEPGSQETWTLQIKDVNGNPLKAPAMLAAWMSDASLDAIMPYDRPYWVSTIYSPSSVFRLWHPSNEFYLNSYWRSFHRSLPDAFSVQFDPNSYLSNSFEPIMLFGYGGSAKRSFSAKAPAVEETAMLAEDADMKSASPEEEEVSTAPNQASMRTNFAETAFFYPRLLANEKGEVSWSFTMPESLTRWRLELLAHGKDMQDAQQTELIEAKKDFMISPNLPRFLRQGDKSELAVSIRNESDAQQSGMLQLELFDLDTKAVLHRAELPFTVASAATESLSFVLNSIDGYQSIGLRLLAKSEQFSDGEQHLLPILPATEEITESIALNIKAGKPLQVDLSKLFPHKGQCPTQGEMRFDVVANPLWVALEAMPIVIETRDQDLISLASAYYCNHLARYLSKQSELQTWAREFKAEKLDAEAMKEADPWLRIRKKEQANKQRLQELILSDSLALQEKDLIDQIAKLQQSDGSFSWFPRMEGSPFLTHYLLRLFARLESYSPASEQSEAMQAIMAKAWRYADAEAYELMKRMEELKGKHEYETLLTNALDYLYLLQVAERTPNAEGNKARSYFLNILLRSLSKIDLDDMPRAAIILEGAGHKAHADKFRQALREHLIAGPDGDLHFSSKNTAYFWCDRSYTLQTETIEALYQSNEAADAERIEQMQAWLLNQKRTQLWPALTSTTDAIHALLLGKGRAIASENAVVRLQMPGETEQHSFQGTKQSLPLSLSSLPEKDPIALVERSGSGFAWAAFFASYTVSSDQVVATGSDMKITKRLYREQIRDGKPFLEPIAAGAELKVGEVILSRFEISLVRDMDFVKVSDDRSACLEALGAISHYGYAASTLYYCEVKDASSNFYFHRLSRGNYVLEYRSRVLRPGSFAPGLARAVCSYAPEYNARTGAEAPLLVTD